VGLIGRLLRETRKAVGKKKRKANWSHLEVQYREERGRAATKKNGGNAITKEKKEEKPLKTGKKKDKIFASSSAGSLE